ncbi:BRO-E [Lymantria xylina nucleopolyhedrovirus]|uniref:BRO-E n=1 Tax=Lymantria xylina multiple nucleopolyhedrovirus TaxID=2847840 RepID=D4N2A6_9ABAC|nr:BRO-E [Lymantria xylina nucleopolyhedrovirus]ADD73778.1 BRO-E [Lymantria xylina nucleopolyhedrovirus]
MNSSHSRPSSAHCSPASRVDRLCVVSLTKKMALQRFEFPMSADEDKIMALQRFEFSMSADEDESKFECWGIVMPDGSVAVKLKELALFLGYADVKMSYKLIPEEWKITWKNLQNELVSKRRQLVAPSTTPANWQPEILFVLEPGVYALMARSNKPMAKEKMNHVYETILPTIRKTGKFRWLFKEVLPELRNDKKPK